MPGAGGHGLRFPLFGFPIRIHPSFLIIAVMLALGTPNTSLSLVVIWTSVVLISVLVHELGHAFAARALGAKPSVELYALGGVTSFVPTRPLGRVASIWVALAGPLAGFALGGFVLSVAGAFGVNHPSLRIYSDASTAEIVVSVAIYVNIVWGFVNLLPIMPLDGGNVVRNLLPGTPEQRTRIATIISVILAGGTCIWVLQNDYAGYVLLPGLLAAVNFYSLISDAKTPNPERTEAVLDSLRQLDDGQPGALASLGERMAQLDPASRDRAKVTAIEILVRQNRGADARTALSTLPGTAHPSSYALVEIVDGAPAHGVAMLDDLFARAPSAPLARYALMGRVLADNAADVARLYPMLPLPLQTPDLLRELQHLSHVRGDFAGSMAIGELLVRSSPQVDPWALYNIACSAARLGNTFYALARLSHAVDAGWTDVAQLDNDQDLASLWVLPEFRAIRLRLTQVSR